jgi:hypothetical protein
VTRSAGTKKKKWYWAQIHQDAFDLVKRTLAEEVILAYPDYGEVFEIYTDASQRQLGAVITQKEKPLAFFSRKLNNAQTKYSVTELELLSIVECLKEFKGMLWGQRIKVYTDHKNLVRDALGLTCDRVYRWRLLLEEYGPEIVYIKGVDNIVADAISRLDYDETFNTRNINVHVRNKCLIKLFNGYVMKTTNSEDFQTDEMYVPIGTHTFVNQLESARANYSTIAFMSHEDRETSAYSVDNDTQAKKHFKYLFANHSTKDEDEIYPVTVSEIAGAQQIHRLYKKYYKNKPFKGKDPSISLKVISDTKVLVYKDKRLVIPTEDMQSKIVQWYHHYLQHPGENRLEETIVAIMWWRGMRPHIRKHVKTCVRCQLGKRRKRKYGHLPPKVAQVIPWNQVCVDLIGPYTIKAKDKTIMDFMCLTIIDPATSWFEIVELPNKDIKYIREKDQEEITEVIIDKSSACVARLFNKSWLCRYPRAVSIVYDNGSEFKLFFENLCESFQLKHKPTTIKNPQANAILERIHQVVTNMMRTSSLDMQETCTPEMIDDFIANVGWAIRSTHHTVLGTTPGAAIFSRDMLFDIPYIADWSKIGKRRQQQVDRSNTTENKNRIDFDYRVGTKCVLIKDGLPRKAEDKNTGPYLITEVYSNGTVRIQRGTINERLNIRRLSPFFEQ